MSLKTPRTLPPTPVPYEAPEFLQRLLAGEHLYHRYDFDGYRVLEAVCYSTGSPSAAWLSVKRFPEIWSQLDTTGGEHRIERIRADAEDIAVGNVIRADAVIYGLQFSMKNVVTVVVEGIMFHMSVRALGGWFESEVEAAIRSLNNGTLLIWRQAYPHNRLMSILTARVLIRREAAETRAILVRWSADVDSHHGK